MIPKSSKFPTRTEFLSFRAKAKQITTPHLRIMISPHRAPNVAVGEVGSRLSVIVPIKVSKRATTRNWLKRLSYDTIWPLLKDRQLDCVVIYKPLPLTKSSITKQKIISELQTIPLENLRI